MCKNHKLLYIPLVFILLYGCTGNRNQSGTTLIKGEIANGEGRTLYLNELDVRKLIRLDSVKIQTNKGTFQFELNPSETGMYVINNNTNDYLMLILKKGESVTIKADMNNLLGSYSVKGSDESALIHDYFKETTERYLFVNDLNTIFNKMKTDEAFHKVRDSLNTVFDSLFLIQKKYVKRFIDENPGSLASLWALNQRFGNSLLLNERNNMNYFIKIDSALQRTYPDNKHAIDHHQRVIQINKRNQEKTIARNRIKPDSLITNFSIAGIDGKAINLYSLSNKYTLVYFWASWSAACRQKNQSLKEIHKKYNSSGFEIFAVSLDNNINLWRNAVDVDQLNWIHASDLRYPSSPVQLLFSIDEVPFSILINSNNRILLVNPNDEQLEKYLSETI